ncbi:MAG: hypothetical protein HZC38_04510, partial [Chloroflexi bacterium]|nr:hypothetical protein [Chloroflexota bacterium]
MKKSILVTLILAGIVLVIASIAAARMVVVANYMNSAAQYASLHLTDSPQPIVGAKVINPKLKVSSDAYYGDAVEVQITRRYQSLYNLDQDFAVTYFYQPDGAGWKQIAPPENFWGAMQTTQGDAVTIVHPQRDAKLVSNLIKVIDSVIFNACAKWSCAADTKPVTITFVTDPTARRDPLTFLAPQLSGVPMNKQANDDYLSNIAAESLIYIAQKIGFDSPYARAFAYRDIQKQNLYAAILDIKVLANTALPRPSEVWAINADRSTFAESVALSFLNFALSKTSVNEADALKSLSTSSSFDEWIVKAKLGEPKQLETE